MLRPGEREETEKEKDKQIILQPMPQQYSHLGAADDWTGVTNSAARRKLQNRINQRAYRKRKQLEVKQQTSPSSSSSSRLHLLPDQLPNSSRISHVDSTNCDVVDVSQNELWMLYHSPASPSQLDRQKLTRVTTICNLSPQEQKKLISQFKLRVERNQRMGSPRAESLLVLVKFNVFRAFLSNGADLGYAAGPGVDDDDALSPFTDPSNAMWHAHPVPTALRLTRLQLQIPHHPWIDILPCPVMRDNLLRAGNDTYDDMALCADLVGCFCADSFGADMGRTGLIVWGEAWDIAGWEVTESFVENWGWTIQGCEHLFRASNHWRGRRGERPLRAKGILYEEG